jgi:ribosome biogenesis protein Tsr3
VNIIDCAAADAFSGREREGMLSRSEISAVDASWKKNKKDQRGVTEFG